jgi:uncharacterized protein (DUF39 family)
MNDCKHPQNKTYRDILNGNVLRCGVCHEIAYTTTSSIPVKSKELKHYKLKEFEEIVTPVIKYMNEFHPHHTLVITNSSAELSEGKLGIHNDSFIKD